jgi:hypothetical protein
MWKPNQLLAPRVVTLLRQSGHFSEDIIEFLGWNQGRAASLNRSGNPVAAGLTMLRDSTPGDDNSKTHEWLEKFVQRKINSVRPDNPHSHETMGKIMRKLGKFQEDWLPEVEEQENDDEEE